MIRKAAVPQARALRRASPVTERDLWKLLRNRRLEGLKFRRQVPMGPYVLDFACMRCRIVVEADGPFHDPVSDAQRDAWLATQGLRILRFSNREIGARDAVIGRFLKAVPEAKPIGDV